MRIVRRSRRTMFGVGDWRIIRLLPDLATTQMRG